MPLIPDTSPVGLLFWNLGAAAAVAGLFIVLWMAIGRTRRGTPALDAALAFAGLVCAEALVLNVLSVFGLVGRTGVLVAHIALLIAVASVLIVLGRKAPFASWRLPRMRALWWAVAPLVVLVAVSAFRYAPNNGDAMTYHLARVAHWIQNGSVAPYPSLSLRQTIMMPGAEYVMAALLAIAGSDHLAMLPQFAAWLIVAAAAPSLARLWGAPSRWAWIAAPAVMATPVIVLQASSTQNDLVAAAMALAVVAATLPLLHRRTCRSNSLIWFGLACAAAGLVKATAVIAALPFAVVAAVTLLRVGLSRARNAALMVAVLIPLCLVLPDAARRQTLTRISSRDFMYGASDNWLDRAVNQGRGLGHHLAIPFVLDIPTGIASRKPGANMPSRPHEDYAGNPLQLAIIAALLGVTLVRWERLPARSRIAGVCWLFGWVTVHAILKDNQYLARLQDSWFVLLPVLFGAVSGLPRGRSRVRSWLAVCTTLILISDGVWVAAHNELRLPLVSTAGPRESHYFRNGSVAMGQQTEALRIAQQVGCRRIALYMGESGFDYPITRAAMAAGMATRHLLADDGWACTIYIERLSLVEWPLPRPIVALKARDWSVAAIGPGGPFVYVRRRTSQIGHY